MHIAGGPEDRKGVKTCFMSVFIALPCSRQRRAWHPTSSSAEVRAVSYGLQEGLGVKAGVARRETGDTKILLSEIERPQILVLVRAENV